MDSVIRPVVGVAAGAFAPGHLGELTRIVPFEMVDAVLAQTGAQQRRARDLPSRVVVYLLARFLRDEAAQLGLVNMLTSFRRATEAEELGLTAELAEFEDERSLTRDCSGMRI